MSMTRELGLTVSLPKTKFMVVGLGVTDEDRLPLPLDVSGTRMGERVPLSRLLNVREWTVP